MSGAAGRPVLVLLVAILGLAGCDQFPNLRPQPAARPEEVASTAVAADRAYREEDWVTAESAYRRLTQVAPGDAENWYRLGNIYAHTDRPGDAVRMYGEALSRDSMHTGAWHNLGLTQLRLAARSFENLESRSEGDEALQRRARRLISAIEAAMDEESGDAGDSGP